MVIYFDKLNPLKLGKTAVSPADMAALAKVVVALCQPQSSASSLTIGLKPIYNLGIRYDMLIICTGCVPCLHSWSTYSWCGTDCYRIEQDSFYRTFPILVFSKVLSLFQESPADQVRHHCWWSLNGVSRPDRAHFSLYSGDSESYLRKG